MRKAEFHVPSEDMTAFVNELTSRELTNSLIGTNVNDEIVIEISYRKDEAEQVDELEDILEELKAREYKEEEES